MADQANPQDCEGEPDKARILVVDDDRAICSMLSDTLESSGFCCDTAHDIQQAMRRIRSARPAAVLLDWMLPGGSGIRLLRQLKEQRLLPGLPVIMLTARIHTDNIVQGLDEGACDYITKPFSTRELIARLRAALRADPEQPQAAAVLRAGPLRFDTEARHAECQGKPLALSPHELRLLEFFMRHPRRAHTRNQIIQQIWAGQDLSERNVDMVVSRLRRRLRSAGGKQCDPIQTVHGIGYRFSFDLRSAPAAESASRSAT